MFLIGMMSSQTSHLSSADMPRTQPEFTAGSPSYTKPFRGLRGHSKGVSGASTAPRGGRKAPITDRNCFGEVPKIVHPRNPNIPVLSGSRLDTSRRLWSSKEGLFLVRQRRHRVELRRRRQPECRPCLGRYFITWRMLVILR